MELPVPPAPGGHCPWGQDVIGALSLSGPRVAQPAFCGHSETSGGSPTRRGRGEAVLPRDLLAGIQEEAGGLQGYKLVGCVCLIFFKFAQSLKGIQATDSIHGIKFTS